ncbi:MAG: hypothetical protein WAO20_16375, partial [Acidobacteriota bacterium]
MKKWVFLFPSVTLVLAGSVGAQTASQIQPPIQVILRNTNRTLAVTVSSWRRHIDSKSDQKYLAWQLDGNSKNLVSRM